MATRKTAKRKSKAKPKRKKAPARKAKKAKAPKRRATPKKGRATRKTKTKAKRPSAKPQQPPPPGPRIGVVTHYFGEPSVAVVKLESGTLRIGDTIHIRGHTSDFEQRVDSLQVDHAPVNEVGPKDDFGMKVTGHAREGDIVYKVR
jgi:sRNA-binding protein